MSSKQYLRRLWFGNGFWWFKISRNGPALEISSLIRREGFNPTAVAQKLGISERSFQRIAQDSLGVSPGVWLRHERAVSARYRLKEGCSIKELSLEYGFKHQGDFAEEFKRRYQLYPSEFQRILKIRILDSTE